MKSILSLVALLTFSFSVALAQPTFSQDIPVATPAEVEELYAAVKRTGKVEIKQRIYNIDKPLEFDNINDTKFDGNGSSFILNNTEADVIIVVNSSRLTLKNFKAKHIEPDGYFGCSGNVINTYKTEYLTIKNCELNGCGMIGVHANESKWLKVLNCYIYNNSKYGILVGEESYVVIKENKFDDNGSTKKDHVATWKDWNESSIEVIKEDKIEGPVRMEENNYVNGN